MYVPVRKLLCGQDHLEFTTVVVMSFFCSYALHVFMHCEQISFAELPDILLTLACKSDVNNALPSHLVFDMHCGCMSISQHLCCRLQIGDCPGAHNLQFEQHRAAFLLVVINLQRLVQALLVRAPDRQMHTIQRRQGLATMSHC